MSPFSLKKKIRVLVVDDSVFFRKVLENALIEDPRIEVVGMAGDAQEAMQKILALQPLSLIHISTTTLPWITNSPNVRTTSPA